jgi:hypothetical protein
VRRASVAAAGAVAGAALLIALGLGSAHGAVAGRSDKTTDERKAQLDSALQRYGASGWRTENRSDFQATIAKGKEHSHLLHLLLTIFTLGLWGLFVWLPLSIFGGLKRRMVTVDAYGNVDEQKL